MPASREIYHYRAQPVLLEEDDDDEDVVVDDEDDDGNCVPARRETHYCQTEPVSKHFASLEPINIRNWQSFQDQPINWEMP